MQQTHRTKTFLTVEGFGKMQYSEWRILWLSDSLTCFILGICYMIRIPIVPFKVVCQLIAQIVEYVSNAENEGNLILLVQVCGLQFTNSFWLVFEIVID